MIDKINAAQRDLDAMAEAGYYFKYEQPIGSLVHEPTRTHISVYKSIGWFKRKMIEWCFGLKYTKHENKVSHR